MNNSVITEYRYISREEKTRGGRPIIKGTRTPVKSIVGYYKLGLSVEEILEGLPHLTPAQVYEALSYYHDHREEMERDIQEGQAKRVIERYSLQITEDGRLVPRDTDA